MSRQELYSPEGLRSDGRRWNELRYLDFEVNKYPKASDGSASVKMGSTHVLCMVQGPREPEQRSKSKSDGAVISVSVTVAPFAGTARRVHQNNERPLQELALNLEATFMEAVLVHAYPHTEIAVYLTVLAEDGGLLSSCVCAMTLALVDAGVPMKDYVMAAGVALTDNALLVDPNHAEEQELPFLTAGVVGSSTQMTLLNIDTRMHKSRVCQAAELAVDACASIREAMDEAVRAHGAKWLEK